MAFDVVLQDAPLLPDSIRREQNRTALALRMQQDDGSGNLNQIPSGAPPIRITSAGLSDAPRIFDTVPCQP